VPADSILDRSHLPRELEKSLKPWLVRGEKAGHSSDYFEAMIYLWVSFNAWLLYAAKDIGEELTDSFLVQAAGHDQILNDKFEQLKQADPGFAQLVAEFSVIYRVRCNLFHGGKSFLYSRDREFVRYAFLILWHVWGKDLLMELSSSRSGSLRRSFKN
jgi:hypothetical protein